MGTHGDEVLMPYESEAQRAYMHEHLPRIAARWDREYPIQGKLPARAGKVRVKRGKKRTR